MAADAFKRVKEIIVEHLDVDPDEVTLEAAIKEDLGADSLDVVDLILNLEQEFDLEQINDEDSEKIATVGDIVTYIETQTQK